jgi:hypothetical protein
VAVAAEREMEGRTFAEGGGNRISAKFDFLCLLNRLQKTGLVGRRPQW